MDHCCFFLPLSDVHLCILILYLMCSHLNKKSIYINVCVFSIFRSPEEPEFLLWNPVGRQVTCICASPVQMETLLL